MKIQTKKVFLQFTIELFSLKHFEVLNRGTARSMKYWKENNRGTARSMKYRKEKNRCRSLWVPKDESNK